MIGKINHIGIAVKDIKESMDFCSKTLGFRVPDIIETPSMLVTMIKVGEIMIELMQSKSPSGAIARFIEKKGEGVQHICLEVDEIRNEVERIKGLGYEFVDDNPKKGLEGDIVFLKPKNTFGVLFELVQK
jgi:methylmalonyl-CoA/ethylmalonyl-CoA epimerase